MSSDILILNVAHETLQSMTMTWMILMLVHAMQRPENRAFSVSNNEEAYRHLLYLSRQLNDCPIEHLPAFSVGNSLV